MLLGLALAPAAAASPRVLSFDQCADEYVLALAPRPGIAGLSTRADDADSLMRERARGLPLRRVNLETALAARPDLVIRTYGGDAGLIRALERRGVRVLTLEEAADFDGVRRNLRHVAAAVGAPETGEAMVADMDRRLGRAAGAWKGRSALYLTPSGFTAGPGTLADGILRAAGLVNVERRQGYNEVPLERFVLEPPEAVVLAFFDTPTYASSSWAPGRHALMQKRLRERAVASLPGATIACANWGAAEAAERLAAQAPK
ncbi:ABC transporter substrate-binding protein [Phenylobacterium sp. LjRoot219]|uniref:ABC transporter substrate-binding protein n=1 Tax=Phenylobacterium sp. LjRoot219 TaxID=3342283 RepID=UPI003ED018BE